ncbi:MAG TPA: hypothetical protein VM573_02775 [Actinomycetota bacterium]|nr:hypothetical protein [Actinomycetota bacterium]
MPEIDPNLYQILTLALWLITALALLGIASELSGIKKSLDRGGTTGSRPESTSSQEAAPARDPEPVATQPAAAQAAWEAEPEPAASSAAPTPTEETATYGGFAPAETASAGQAQPAAQAVQEAQPAAAQAEPEEQPFERDGRWWFRRGDELLVYDERSGEWTPAPEEATGGAATAAGASSAAEGGFWKCPSCGAVNGSTAATCRMCFTARP